MDFGNSLSYVFDDQAWVSKLAMLLLIMLLSAVPLLGLLALAVAMGYMVELVGNVRSGHPTPLPTWEGVETKFRIGGYLLVAWFVYHLPFVMFFGCTTWLIGAIAGGFLGDLTFYVIACCLAPFALIYIALAWAMFALATTEYADTLDHNIYYRLADLWWSLQRYGSITIQWMIMSFFANALISLLALIPCLGWIAAPALAIPWHGHLLGQYARHVGIDSDRRQQIKRKKMRS